MLLSEMNMKEIPVGLDVVSAMGISGKVTKCSKEEDNPTKPPQDRVRFDTIFIDWENGRKSIVFHMQSNFIKVKNEI